MTHFGAILCGRNRILNGKTNLVSARRHVQREPSASGAGEKTKDSTRLDSSPLDTSAGRPIGSLDDISSSGAPIIANLGLRV